MVSLFGESEYDMRDFGFAFAALKSSLYLARVQAAAGQLSLVDAEAHSRMVRDGLSIVPASQLSDAGRQAVEDTLGEIEVAAARKFKGYGNA